MNDNPITENDNYTNNEDLKTEEIIPPHPLIDDDPFEKIHQINDYFVNQYSDGPPHPSIQNHLSQDSQQNLHSSFYYDNEVPQHNDIFNFYDDDDC